jgi:DtxR family Mn-dependent transcriptional regulator
MVNKGVLDRSPERARQDYLKVIYQLGERRPVRGTDVARHLGVTRASVSKFKRMLEREQLIEPARGRTDTLRLTGKGKRLALRMVRRHRLLETFLHDTLHLPLDRVHSEAERIEHAISEDVAVRLARFLRHPLTDPHGHRIPDGIAAPAHLKETSLAAVEPPASIVVASVDDGDPFTLRRLEDMGILPGVFARVIVRDGLAVHMRAKRRNVVVPLDIARAVQCTVAHARRRPA